MKKAYFVNVEKVRNINSLFNDILETINWKLKRQRSS